MLLARELVEPTLALVLVEQEGSDGSTGEKAGGLGVLERVSSSLDMRETALLLGDGDARPLQPPPVVPENGAEAAYAGGGLPAAGSGGCGCGSNEAESVDRIDSTSSSSLELVVLCEFDSGDSGARLIGAVANVVPREWCRLRDDDGDERAGDATLPSSAVAAALRLRLGFACTAPAPVREPAADPRSSIANAHASLSLSVSVSRYLSRVECVPVESWSLRLVVLRRWVVALVALGVITRQRHWT